MAGADRDPDPECGPVAAALLDPLEDRGHLALAVSGGSDSVALMWLARCWLDAGGRGTTFSVLTVDHGLRAESLNETRRVATWAGKAGLPHRTLSWRGEKPGSGLQDAARLARYELMSAWCRENGAAAIVTAHTLDDQAETVLMRLGRGSGLDGLSGMASELATPWHVLRPLLNVSRQALRDWLADQGKTWIDDPSNEDMRFERVRVRRALDCLADAGIETVAIGVSARRLMRARQALDTLAGELWDTAVERDESGRLLIAREQIDAVPADLRLRVLDRALRETGGQVFSRMAALERLEAWITGHCGARARTLGGCRVSLRKRHIVVAREPGRRP